MIECKEVIITDLELRGNGKPEEPYRRVTQVYEKDGSFIAENDPVHKYTHYDLINFAKWCDAQGIPGSSIDISYLRKWLKKTS